MNENSRFFWLATFAAKKFEHNDSHATPRCFFIDRKTIKPATGVLPVTHAGIEFLSPLSRPLSLSLSFYFFYWQDSSCDAGPGCLLHQFRLGSCELRVYAVVGCTNSTGQWDRESRPGRTCRRACFLAFCKFSVVCALDRWQVRANRRRVEDLLRSASSCLHCFCRK